MKTWTPGEKMLASDLNANFTAVEGLALANAHNIIQLYIEEYFAGKYPSYNGLFFDGFSDVTKQDTDIATALTASAVATDTTIDVGAFTSADLNKDFDIYSGSLRETVKATAVADVESQLLADDFDRTDSATVGGGWDDSYESSILTSAIVSNALEFEKVGNNNGGTEVRVNQTLDVYEGLTLKADFFIEIPASPYRADYNARMDVCTLIGGYTKNDKRMGLYLDYDGNADTVYISLYMVGQERVGPVAFATGITDDFGSEADPYKVEVIIGAGASVGQNPVEIRLWRSSDTKPTTATMEKTYNYYTPTGQAYAFLDAEFYNGSDQSKVRILDYEVVQGAKRVTVTPALTNAYASGDNVKRSTAQIDTGNKKLQMQASIGDGKLQTYHSELQSFQQKMSKVKLWIRRNYSAQYSLDSAPSGSTVVIDGDKTGQLASGDTVDISTANNNTRERRTISAIDYNTTTTGKTTITTDTALTGTYTTSDFVERVDAIPQASLVASGASESFASMTYVRSELDSTNSEVEDEYEYTPSASARDFKAKITLTRNDTSLSPYAKMLGASLIT
jgi:hypothetical protein